jgi:nucleotide-binding universal stress UspA family protein
MTSIVVGHSRDPASQEALRVARDLAERLGARLHVVHGVDLGDYPINPDAADWEEQAERTLAEQQVQVQTALANCPQGWTYSASRGGPVGLISGVAEEKDALMIIVGTRGEGLGPAIERLLDGSVSRGLIRHQHRPVLVVHAPRSCPNAREAVWVACTGRGWRSTSWSNLLARRFRCH